MEKQLIKLTKNLSTQVRVLYTYSGYSFNKDTNKVYKDKQNDKYDKYNKYKYYTYN